MLHGISDPGTENKTLDKNYGDLKKYGLYMVTIYQIYCFKIYHTEVRFEELLYT